MQQTFTWFRRRWKRLRNDSGQILLAIKPRVVQKRVDNLAWSAHKPIETPVNKAADIPVDNSGSNETTVSTTCATHHSGLQVIPVLDDNDTIVSAICKGLERLGKAKIMMCDLGHERITQLMAGPVARTIMDLINTMARVADTAKPRRIHAYHVYTTRTAIAGYINIRNIIVTSYNPITEVLREKLDADLALKDIFRAFIYLGKEMDADLALKDIFTASIYLGMATLVTPETYSVHLASAIEGLVQEAARRRISWSRKEIYEIVSATTRGIVRDLTICCTPPSPPPKLPNLCPPASILTSEELAGLARALAVRQRRDYGTAPTIEGAAKILDSLFAQPERGCPCRRDDYPVCVCNLKPLSENEYGGRGGCLLQDV